MYAEELRFHLAPLPGWDELSEEEVGRKRAANARKMRPWPGYGVSCLAFPRPLPPGYWDCR